MSAQVEPMNFVNPPLVWKPGPKGLRNSSRRARKSVTTSFTVDEFTRKVDDAEKHGVAIPGSQFSEDNHVPIKKRRFRSPSPSSSPKKTAPVPGSNLNKKRLRGITNTSHRKKSSQKISEVNGTGFDHSGDFSGIEILAAVACSSSIFDDVLNEEESTSFDETTQEGVDSSASAILFEEAAVSQKDLASEDKRVALSLQDGKSTILHNCSSVDSTKATEEKKSSQSCRLHWDLNVAMDAWIQSPDNSPTSAVENNLTVGSEKLETLENCRMKGVCEGTLVCDFNESKSSGKIDNRKICHEHSDCQAVFEENMATNPSDAAFKESTEICSSDAQLKKLMPTESGEPEAGNDDSLNISEGATCNQVALPGVEVSNPDCTPNCEETSVSGVSPVECQPVVALDVKGSGSESYHQGMLFTKSVDSPREASKMHNTDPPSCLNKVTTGDPLDDGYESDIYQDDKIQNIGTANSMELQVGYDSQYEDGELRDSDARYCWGENEDEDGDVERVDYGSDSDVERPCGSDSGQEQNIERGSTTGFVKETKEIENCGATGAQRDELESPKTKTSDVTTDSGMVRSRTSDREFLYRAERSRYNDASKLYTRDGRGAQRDVRPCRGRSPGGRYFINPSPVYRDSEQHYRGSYAYGPRRLKDRGYVSSSHHRDIGEKEFGGFDNHVRRQYVDFSSNSKFGRNTRTRSLTYQNDAYGSTSPVRNVGPVSCTRFRRFPAAIDRGVSKGYYRPVPEDRAAYPDYMTHRMPARDRSISPVHRVRPYHGIQSKSRSRSRSPTLFIPARERIDSSRIRSRSPDFKSDARMDRMRMPFQKNFSAGHEERFTSPSRSHFSPRHSYRSYNERYYPTENNFRGRRSPDRMSQHYQRFDSRDSLRRSNPPNQFKPVIQSHKFSDIEGGRAEDEYGGRGGDIRKFGTKVEMVHRARHHDRDGVLGRIRHDKKESFAVDDPNSTAERRKPNDPLLSTAS